MVTLICRHFISTRDININYLLGDVDISAVISTSDLEYLLGDVDMSHVISTRDLYCILTW